MQHVELVQRQQVDQPQHVRLRHEVPCHVQQAAAPAEPRPVLDLDAGHLPTRLRRHRRPPEDGRRQQLAQGLHPVERAGGVPRGDPHPLGGDGHPVLLRGQRPVQAEHDAARPVGEGAAGRRGQLLAQDGGDRRKRGLSGERGGGPEGVRARPRGAAGRFGDDHQAPSCRGFRRGSSAPTATDPDSGPRGGAQRGPPAVAARPPVGAGAPAATAAARRERLLRCTGPHFCWALASLTAWSAPFCGLRPPR